jgi:hypothetical protein
MLDCSNGMSLWISSGGQVVRLHTDEPSKLEFVSYTAGVTDSIACGPTAPPGIPVVVTYKAQNSGDFQGVPQVVEFTEKN